MICSIAPLFRLKLSLLNGIAAVAGYLLFPARFEISPALSAFIGVFLLAAGSSAANQVMECDLDARMLRTRLRPLPRRKMSILAASASAGCAVAAGLLVLVTAGGWKAALFGGCAVAWYLGVYTPLKRLTSLSLLVGGLCGAFPPLIGWSLAGGNSGDFRIVMLTGLLFLWQVPHFWLFQRRHGEDYRRAGIPLFSTSGSLCGFNAFFWLWLGALSVAALLLPVFGIIERPGAFWYLLFPLPLLFLATFRSGQLLFPYINCFPLLVTMVLMLQKQY
jgi:protoheme IX farnesyltransferase